MLLDSYVTRLEIMPGRTPFVIQDLLDLMPEAILLGHGHFDHADNAAYIAQETGATIYASPETCDNMAIDANKNFVAGYTLVPTVTCVPLTDRGSLPGRTDGQDRLVRARDPHRGLQAPALDQHRRERSRCDPDRSDIRRCLHSYSDSGQHLPLQPSGPA